jgi:hypothetical protein
MKRSKFSEQQIIAILKAVGSGRSVSEVCRENEIAGTTGIVRLTAEDGAGGFDAAYFSDAHLRLSVPSPSIPC